MAFGAARAEDLFILPGEIELSPDYATVEAGGSVTVDVLGNDGGVSPRSVPRIAAFPGCGTIRTEGRALVFDSTLDCPESVEFSYGVSETVSDLTTTVTIAVTLPEPHEPTEPLRVARDDEASIFADTPVTVLILENDDFAPDDPPVVSIDSDAACGRSELADGRLTYYPNPDCEGEMLVVYRFDSGETARVRITLSPPPPACPDIDGMRMVNVPKTQLDLGEIRERGGFAADLLQKLEPYHDLADGTFVEEFCIALEHVPLHMSSGAPDTNSCRQRDTRELAVGFDVSSARNAVRDIAHPDDWSIGLPSAEEMLAALEQMESAGGEAGRDLSIFVNSLRRGAREWLSTSCGEGSSILVGGDCNRDTTVFCLGHDLAYDDLGMRAVMRKN